MGTVSRTPRTSQRRHPAPVGAPSTREGTHRHKPPLGAQVVKKSRTSLERGKWRGEVLPWGWGCPGSVGAPVWGCPGLGVQSAAGQGWMGQFPHPILEQMWLPPPHPLFSADFAAGSNISGCVVCPLCVPGCPPSHLGTAGTAGPAATHRRAQWDTCCVPRGTEQPPTSPGPLSMSHG